MPSIPIDIGVHLKKNHLLMLVVLSFFFMQFIKRKRINYIPFMFCILYLTLSLLSIPFKETKFSIQLYHIIYDGAIALLFPIAIWNVSLNENCITTYRKVLVSCIAIVSVYGLALITSKGINPWTALFSIFDGENPAFWAKYYFDENRIFGRISSVFYHPMHFGAFLGFATIYIVYIKNELSKKSYILIFLFLIINMITCGVRSVLAAIMASVLVFILLKRNFILAMKIVLFFLIIFIIVLSIPDLNTYISSIFSSSTGESVGGSSLEMRIDQLGGAFEEIESNPLFGKGYGWSNEYIIENENHPVLLGFESIIFVVLCNNGIIGLILFLLFGVFYCLYVNHYVIDEDKPFFISILVFYYAYECITGEFAFHFLMLFYSFMLLENYNRQHQSETIQMSCENE